MAKRVNLDAMIPRADFGEVGTTSQQGRIMAFGLEQLVDTSPIFKSLRKPDFQRETNHWSAKQISDLIQSFLDDELVPSLILWESPAYIFVIDGGHRLSALKAWMADDYGDGFLSMKFYGGTISKDQRQIAKTARNLVEREVGRFSDLSRLAGETTKLGGLEQMARANMMFRRALTVQMVFGTKKKAESSFFKINSQGTILDDVETSLIRNRQKPIAIAARSIIRAGAGHNYGAEFTSENERKLANYSAELYNILFEPEVETPLKTLDIPLGGSVSPVNALALLIDFLAITGRPSKESKSISDYADDETGADTIALMERTLKVVKRMTTNHPGSLGLHPAVYYYSLQGKHNRFLMLGMAQLISTAVINNNDGFFSRFTKVRKALEDFLIREKGLVTLLLQNLDSKVRAIRVSEMLAYLILECAENSLVSPLALLNHLGIGGTVYNLNLARTNTDFSGEVKSQTYVSKAIATALRCPQCAGLVSPVHSLSYDHIQPVRDGGLGDVENCDIMHPYCNSAMKS